MTITDGGGRRPMIRPSLDMYGTRVTNFVPNPLVSERVLAYPATRVPAAPSIRSLIGNESSARGLDTQVFHAVSARQVHVQHGDAISAKACTPKQAWNQYSTPGVSTKFPGIDEWKATFIYGRH